MVILVEWVFCFFLVNGFVSIVMCFVILVCLFERDYGIWVEDVGWVEFVFDCGEDLYFGVVDFFGQLGCVVLVDCVVVVDCFFGCQDCVVCLCFYCFLDGEWIGVDVGEYGEVQ